MPNKFAKPQEVKDVDLAFGGSIADLMPAYSVIPTEFKSRNHPWNQVVQEWFFKGLKGTLVPKEGIDLALATRHLKAIMASWAPKHEHKMAGVAYLMSLWFERYEPAQETK